MISFVVTLERTPLVETVARLAERGEPLMSLEDIGRRLGTDPERTRAVARRLTAAGLLRRIRRGLYAIVPPEEWLDRDTTSLNWYRVATQVVRDQPHYIGYYTAMELHRMLQHPVRTVFVVAPRFHRGFQLGPATVRFVKVAPARIFGHEQRRIDGEVVEVSDLERTLIDCVDRPDLCGGLEEIVRGLRRRHTDVDPDRLLRYVHRLQRPVLTKRLGYLLELVGHADRELVWDLEAAAGRLGRYVPLDKTRPAHRQHPRDARWELILNVEPRDLLRATRT